VRSAHRRIGAFLIGSREKDDPSCALIEYKRETTRDVVAIPVESGNCALRGGVREAKKSAHYFDEFVMTQRRS
jgi:hypothetical protein